MYRVFLTGGIASGKSYVAHQLELRGAARVDLDTLSREVLAPGSDVLAQVAERFGQDLLDEQGALNRALLAERVFSSAQALSDLEALEHPAIYNLLTRHLCELSAEVAVVEIPLLNKAGRTLELADEIVAVTAPESLRRARAIGRGMSASDFAARAARQPSDDYLRARAHTVFENDGTPEQLVQQIDAWWERRARSGWRRLSQGGERLG